MGNTGNEVDTGRPAESARRSLHFSNFAEVIADAESLLDAGWQRQGQWDLAQVCDHLAAWLTFPMDGFPRAPFSCECSCGYCGTRLVVENWSVCFAANSSPMELRRFAVQSCRPIETPPERLSDSDAS